MVTADSRGEARHYEALDPEPGFVGMVSGENPDGHFIGWSPGSTPRPFGEGMAWKAEPGTDLVVQLHLLPGGKPEKVEPLIALYFTEEPPTQIPVTVRLGSATIDIEAGDGDHIERDALTLPAAVDLFSVYPHAHFLCSRIMAWAELPDGGREPLLRISDWDFDWQGDYQYQKPVRLPAGATVRVEFLYDNTANNVDNPNSPPRRVRWGPRSSDEMAELWLKAVPVNPDDRDAIELAVLEHYMMDQLAGFRRRLEEFPDDLEANSRVGHLLVARGEGLAAIPCLKRALERSPKAWGLLNDLGIAMVRSGEVGPAVERFQESIRLNPAFPPPHNGLATALALLGRPVEAIPHLESYLKRRPADAGAWNNLGVIRARLGDLEQAEASYRKAIACAPGDAGGYLNLATLSERTGRPQQAERMFHAAIERDQDSDEIRMRFASFLAKQRRYEEAAGQAGAVLRRNPEHVEAASALRKLRGLSR